MNSLSVSRTSRRTPCLTTCCRATTMAQYSASKAGRLPFKCWRASHRTLSLLGSKSTIPNPVPTAFLDRPLTCNTYGRSGSIISSLRGNDLLIGAGMSTPIPETVGVATIGDSTELGAMMAERERRRATGSTLNRRGTSSCLVPDTFMLRRASSRRNAATGIRCTADRVNSVACDPQSDDDSFSPSKKARTPVRVTSVDVVPTTSSSTNAIELEKVRVEIVGNLECHRTGFLGIDENRSLAKKTGTGGRICLGTGMRDTVM